MGLEVATAMAISAGVSAVTAGGSFIQAGKQRRLAEEAQRDADKAFKDAQKQLDVNYFEQLGISKTPYENQREAIAQAGAQAIEAAGASERGGAATAGRVLAQSNIAQQGITDQQTRDLQNLEKLVATEDAKLASKRGELSLAQAEGAGIAAAQAQNNANQSTQSGVNNLANTGLAIMSNSELYKQNNPAIPDATYQGGTLPNIMNPNIFSNPTTSAGLNTQVGNQIVLPQQAFNIFGQPIDPTLINPYSKNNG